MPRLSLRGRYAVLGHDRLGAFVLRVRPGGARSVRIRVQQLAPTCRDLGSIVRRVPAGQTRLRVPARIDGRAFEPGTYLLDLGRDGSVVVAVFAKRPSPAKVREQLRKDACDMAAVSAAAAAKAFRFDRVTTGWTTAAGRAGPRAGEESSQTGGSARVRVASALAGAIQSGTESLLDTSAGAVRRFELPDTVIALVVFALLLLVAAQVFTRPRLLNGIVAVAGALAASVLTVLLLLLVGI